MLGHLKSVTIQSCPKIRDISSLGKVLYLHVSECHGIETFCTPLGHNNQNWIFRFVSISNVTHFDRLHSLTLSYCVNVTKFDHLGAVEKLRIVGSSQLVDVRPFAKVKILDLIYCDRIEDVSMLGNVHSLCLVGCDNIKSVDGLERVSKLQLPKHLSNRYNIVKSLSKRIN